MKSWSIGLFLLVLAGCAQQPPPQSDEVALNDEAAPSCVAQLSQQEESVNTYVQAFQACEEPITEEELVQRYVQALIVTGQYQALLEGSAFSENVDAELAQHWMNWAKEALQ
ncbi:hypothetical protein [Vibrio alginolyticus]|uniref:hypothetical protein n=1 Tax=Vibrio alginolyticus TaxID=663 RepID=UPI000722598E|nr:hypothetical protein [Vibrio alginolyticus]ALR95753.1 hypothetical protein AT730_26320 [Vibrio alginolyticus]ALR95806.1 hypothetical protein AT730_24655 [Vibrio alginolyticus]MBY7710972.1 hypothetical protein [Vibrio alginolyticus]